MSLSARALLVAAAVLPHAIKILYYPSYPGFDDAFIHLRVAENVALGKGWGVNAFEPINISSSPLFTLLLTGGHWLATSVLQFGMLISAAATSAAIVLAFVLTRPTVSTPALAVIPAAIFAADVHLWRWNATAMEPTLACLALGLALAVFGWAKQGPPSRFVLFGLAAAIACLTRFELGLLLPAAGIVLLIAPEKRLDAGLAAKRLLATLAGFLPLVGAWLLFCWQTFGTVLPTTFLSKASSISLTNTVTVRSIVVVLVSALGVPLVLLALTVWRAARPRAWVAIGGLPGPFLLPVIFSLLCVAFYAIAVPEFQSAARYLLPVLYALSIVVGGMIARAIDRSRLRWAPVVSVAAGAQILAMLAINHMAVAPTLRGFDDNYWRASRQAAGYLIETAAPGDTVVALSDIGMLAYYSQDRYRVVDRPGLAAPSLAGLSPDDIVNRTHPRFVVEHYGDADISELDGVPESTYMRVRAFPFAAAGLVSTRGAFSLNVYQRRER